jgi:hypothetical protein
MLINWFSRFLLWNFLRFCLGNKQVARVGKVTRWNFEALSSLLIWWREKFGRFFCSFRKKEKGFFLLFGVENSRSVREVAQTMLDAIGFKPIELDTHAIDSQACLTQRKFDLKASMSPKLQTAPTQSHSPFLTSFSEISNRQFVWHDWKLPVIKFNRKGSQENFLIFYPPTPVMFDFTLRLRKSQYHFTFHEAHYRYQKKALAELETKRLSVNKPFCSYSDSPPPRHR